MTTPRSKTFFKKKLCDFKKGEKTYNSTRLIPSVTVASKLSLVKTTTLESPLQETKITVINKKIKANKLFIFFLSIIIIIKKKTKEMF